MTEFAYLSVLISIVIGLGLWHLLSGTAGLIRQREGVHVFLAPAVLIGFSVYVILLFLRLV